MGWCSSGFCFFCSDGRVWACALEMGPLVVRPPGLPVGKKACSGILDAAVWSKHSTLAKPASMPCFFYAGHYTTLGAEHKLKC